MKKELMLTKKYIKYKMQKGILIDARKIASRKAAMQKKKWRKSNENSILWSTTFWKKCIYS